jgi:hypothetical protein
MKVDAQANGHAPLPEADQRDSSIYDFSTYADGEVAVRLLKQNGFDATDLSLVGKGHPGEWHPLGFPWNGEKTNSHQGQNGFWGRVSNFVGSHLMSAPHAGPQILVMHGSSAETARAHGVLVERTNELIEECLQFR